MSQRFAPIVWQRLRNILICPFTTSGIFLERTALDVAAEVRPRILILAAATVFVGLSLWEMHDESVTTDELVHLSAGYTYLAKRDYRLNPEHPALAKMLAAVPLLFLRPRMPTEQQFWDQGLEWQFGYKFLYQSGNDPDLILFWSRVPMILWGLLLLGSVYALSKELFGARGALISLILVTFCPMILGHAHLVTTDVPIASMVLLTSTAFWRFAETPTSARAVIAGLVLGGALAVKYSAVIMGPALLWLLIVAWVKRSKETGASRLQWRILLKDAFRWAALLLIISSACLLVIWGCYRFRYRASEDPTFQFSWSFEATGNSVIGRAVRFARAHHLLPEAYLNGFAYMFENAQARDAYALGKHSKVGWWWYFPFAFLVKTPVPSLGFMAWGLWASLRRYGARLGRDYFLIIPLLIYWVLAIGSNINIGLRHVMPVYPIMATLAGGIPLDGIPGRAGRLAKRLTLVALSLVVAGCLMAGPYYLAYFNLPSIVIFDRHFMLTDSNLDWGQDLKRLKKWMDREGIPQIKLAYFGNASPRHLGLRHERHHAANMYQAFEPEWRWASDFRAGDYLAIGATNYSGVVLGELTDYYSRRLVKLRPVAVIGNSILVFRLPEGFRWIP
jgi:hypothetical protein